jgi:hypothetical protein
MALGSTQPLNKMSTRGISWGGKGGRGKGLTTLPLSCVDCLEILDAPTTPKGMSTPVKGLLYPYLSFNPCHQGIWKFICQVVQGWWLDFTSQVTVTLFKKWNAEPAGPHIHYYNAAFGQQRLHFILLQGYLNLSKWFMKKASIFWTEKIK